MSTASEDVFVVGHKWRKNSVLIQTKAAISGRAHISYKELNFKKLNISPKGLLAKCIHDSSPPIDNADAYVVLSTVKCIAPESIEFRRILSAEPCTLRLIDISNLFAISDAHFKKTKLLTSPASAEKFRSFILRCQSTLSGNLLAGQCTYKSPLKVPSRSPRKDIASHGDETQTLGKIKPSEAIVVQDIGAFKALAQNHYEATLKPILQTCAIIFDTHDELKELLIQIGKEPLPENLTVANLANLKRKRGPIDCRMIKKQSPTNQLIIALAVIKRDKLAKNSPRASIIPPKGIPLVDKLSGAGSARSRYATLLSQLYLSKQVVMACYVVLLFHGRWNGDTLISVTPSNVKRTAHGFEISGIKGKTGSNQNTSVLIDDNSTIIEETLAVRALELLLWHNKNIDLHANREHPSMFVAMGHSYHGKITFNVFLSAKYFHEFTSAWNLPRFTASDIRPNAERHRFLQNGMHIEDTRVTLYHKKASTSTHYVAGEIATGINEAIIIRYSAMLASAIIYRFDNAPISGIFTENQKNTIQHLLLPPTRFSSNNDDYLVDMWLAAPGDFSFTVGYPEVDQCVRQRKYYLSNMQSLQRSNPERFAHSDLPRILVCIALYGLIKDSDFRHYLEQVEERINAQKPKT